MCHIHSNDGYVIITLIVGIAVYKSPYGLVSRVCLRTLNISGNAPFVGPTHISHSTVYIRPRRAPLVLHAVLPAMEGTAGGKLDVSASNHRTRVIIAKLFHAGYSSTTMNVPLLDPSPGAHRTQEAPRSLICATHDKVLLVQLTQNKITIT